MSDHSKWIPVSISLDDLTLLRGIADKLKMDQTKYDKIIERAIQEFIKRHKK